MKTRMTGWVLGMALGFLSLPVFAGKMEDVLETRWRGAWVLTTADVYSECSGTYTDNDVNGGLVRSKGRFRFRAGELAQVKDLDLERSGVVLSLSLPEPLLVSFQEGPFTLYNEARCLVSLDMELPRQMVSHKDLNAIEGEITQVVTRFTRQDEAMRSRAWNRRKCDPYPEDYDRTLAKHAAWKAQQTNDAIQARISQASEESSRITDRVSGNPDYLKGFAAGIEAVRSIDLSTCDELLLRSFQNIVPRPPQMAATLLGSAAAEYQRGFQDGGKLVFALESLRRLNGCMVEVPEVPEEPSRPERIRR
jgi:hypothetical protein